MVVLENGLLLDGVLYAVLDLIRRLFRFEVHQTSGVKTLQAEQQRLLDEQQRLYDERAKLKKEARMIDTLKANVDDFLKPNAERDQEYQRNSQRE